MTTDTPLLPKRGFRTENEPKVEASDPLAERHRRIQELAYLKAERRGFVPGFEVEDWLQAEREVDAGARPALLRRAFEPAPQPQRRNGAIEHRQGERVVTRFPIRLNLHDGRMYYGFACDIGPDGMFVRTPAQLNKGCCFDIRIAARDGTGGVRVDIPAFVIHQANGGLGLMFRSLDQTAAATVQRLRRLAFAAAAAQSSSQGMRRSYA